MATNKLKFGTETPSKLYMGDSEVTKVYMGETLVYETSEQDELAGTWIFNEQLNTTALANTYVNFTSNGKTCSSITRDYSTGMFISDAMLYNFDGSYKQVYDVGSWANSGYKTITITSKLSEVTDGNALLAWLQANATKQ